MTAVNVLAVNRLFSVASRIDRYWIFITLFDNFLVNTRQQIVQFWLNFTPESPIL